MLEILKGLWGRGNNTQEMATGRIEAASIHRLRQEYEQEVLMKVFQDPDYNELQESIYEKEKNVLQIINALDILYKAKETLTESIQEKIKEETPFAHEEEYQKLIGPLYYGPTGFTGYTGVSGSAGTTGSIVSFSGSLGSGPYPITYTNNNINTLQPLTPWTPQKNP
jgi:hypothetical protein